MDPYAMNLLNKDQRKEFVDETVQIFENEFLGYLK